MTILCGVFYAICLVLILFGAAYALSCEGQRGYQPTHDLTRPGQDTHPYREAVLPKADEMDTGLTIANQNQNDECG
jgi:hypothetical protein